jgi:pSer/pThr/pTyr-binding forkhead associated (FHA) protein
MLSGHLDTSIDPTARHLLTPRELTWIRSAEKANEPFLVYRDSGARLAIHMLGSKGEGEVVTVGRHSDNHLSLSWDCEVSGLHAELRRLGGEWTIADDGFSTNGTFVEETRIKGRHRLKHGDRIRVGRTVLVYYRTQVAVVGRTLTSSPTRVWPVPTQSQRRVLVALCRPYLNGSIHPGPATNRQIAAETILSIDAVKTHLRSMFANFGLSDLPPARKRARLAEIALELGIVSVRDI